MKKTGNQLSKIWWWLGFLDWWTLSDPVFCKPFSSVNAQVLMFGWSPETT